MEWCPRENFMVGVYYGGCVEEVTIMGGLMELTFHWDQFATE